MKPMSRQLHKRMMCAVTNGKYELIGKFIELAYRQGLNIGEIVHVLVESGADPTINIGNGFSLSDHVMIEAIRGNTASDSSVDELTFNLPVNRSHSRIISAASFGDDEVLKTLLACSIPDETKTLAFHETLCSSSYECCQLLLDSGADPDAIGIQGADPLTIAASELEVDIAGLLHSYGAKLETATYRGLTPLYIACQSKAANFPDEDHFEQKRLMMAALLLGRGAEVDCCNRRGWTPLRHAVIANDIELTRLLLQHGANPDRADNCGVTPIQLAEQNCSSELVDLLRKCVK